MRRVDAAAFLSTAIAVLLVNSILAVAIGCSFYLLRFVAIRYQLQRRRRAVAVAVAFEETMTTTSTR